MAGITHLKEMQKPALRGLTVLIENDKAPTLADEFLPDGQTFSSTFAYDIVKKSNHIAAYIGYGAEPPVIDRDAVASQMGEVAKLGLKYIATEEELLALNQARSDAEKSAMVDQLVVKAADLVNALRKRVDISKLEALLKGTFSYNKNGVKINVNYGIEAPVSKTGVNAWTATATAKPLSDLIEWNDAYVTKNGKIADAIIMSREAQSLLQTNAEFITEARGATGVFSRISVAEVNDVLAGYGLPSIKIQAERSITVKDIYSGADEVIEFLPKYRVVFASRGAGQYLFGPTVENDYKPGIDLRAYDKFEPIQSIIRVAAAGVPVVENPSLIFHANVGV
ncbi:major capsid protein [Sporosarcina sp. E16_3]|uniref:major capsid protein n=1 Tax=Sporosarcina sp. E16_3 TaxID=2789293 RepID=UPI001A90D8F4|nr:major capsid protein [Sporosarcina sp. E16_3]MBO0602706.1 major capsid protein [Sporosarcina sp. E16_3]